MLAHMEPHKICIRGKLEKIHETIRYALEKGDSLINISWLTVRHVGLMARV